MLYNFSTRIIGFLIPLLCFLDSIVTLSWFCILLACAQTFHIFSLLFHQTHHSFSLLAHSQLYFYHLYLILMCYGVPQQNWFFKTKVQTGPNHNPWLVPSQSFASFLYSPSNEGPKFDTTCNVSLKKCHIAWLYPSISSPKSMRSQKILM